MNRFEKRKNAFQRLNGEIEDFERLAVGSRGIILRHLRIHGKASAGDSEERLLFKNVYLATHLLKALHEVHEEAGRMSPAQRSLFVERLEAGVTDVIEMRKLSREMKYITLPSGE